MRDAAEEAAWLPRSPLGRRLTEMNEMVELDTEFVRQKHTLSLRFAIQDEQVQP